MDVPVDDEERGGPTPTMVVGIGASAGGLAPLQEFFEAISPTAGFAYVIAQHPSPDHATVMDSLLARNTKMPVLTAADGMELRADHVYLLPLRAELIVGPRTLEVSEQVRLPGVPPHPIDICFESLAEAWGTRSVAIVLSGTGDDGTAGIQAVREHGGFTIVQDSSARFSSMPGSTDRSGAVDQILAPRSMPDAIVRLANDPDVARIPVATDANGEYSRIISAVSIRDPEVWDHLASTVIPSIVADAQRDDREIRIWVAACAMGHEAYSYAMLVLDQLEREGIDLSVRIFATDADQRSLATSPSRQQRPTRACRSPAAVR